MQAWFDALSFLQKAMFILATPAAMILVLQLLLMLFGIGHDDSFDNVSDMDIDTVDGVVNDNHLVDVGSIKLFTLRSVLAFLAVGGFSGVSAIELGTSDVLACIIALASGALAGFVVAYLLHLAMHLQSSGNIALKNAIGLPASVYIPIGAHRATVGKVNVTVQHRLVEVDALTDDDSPLATMQTVQIIGIENQCVLVTASK